MRVGILFSGVKSGPMKGIYAQEGDQEKLGEILDERVLVVPDYDLHLDIGKTSTISGIPYFLN